MRAAAFWASAWRADVLLACAAGLVTFAVYVRTMYPDLIALGDAAKFSFVGRVLGTPHAPGNPLYVVISHLFSYVPWGTLAHRMHGLSAIFGSLTVVLAYFIARQLGCHRAVALASSLGLGFGRVFWSKAQYAKSYTLTAALVSLGLLLLLRWSGSRRNRDLWLAVGVFSLCVGAHLIVVALVPALMLFVLLTDRRAALSWRTQAASACLIGLGLAQYLLVFVRTAQEAPYLEAKATTLRELASVMIGGRYFSEVGAFGWSAIVSHRLPALWDLILAEFGWGCLCAILIGSLVLLRHRWRTVILLAAGAAGIIALTASMSSNEDAGFLLIAFLLMWPLAAIGFQRLAEAAWTGRRWAGVAVASCLVLALPYTQVSANYKVNDHSRRTFETRYFNSLFSMLPHRAAIIEDDYNMNMMVLYKILGEGAAGDRDITLIPREQDAVRLAHAAGRPVFAFRRGESSLGQYGFTFEPAPLLDLPLPDYLQTAVPPGDIVIVAALPDAADGLVSNPGAWASIGGSEDGFLSRAGLPYAIVGVKGAQEGRAAESYGGTASVIEVAAGSPVAGTRTQARETIRVDFSRTHAAVSVGGREQIRIASGAILVTIDRAGSVAAHTLDPQQELRIPFRLASTPYRLVRLADVLTCTNLGNSGWKDTSALASGGSFTLRIDNYRAFDATATAYVMGTGPWNPRVTTTAGRGTPRLTVSTFSTRTVEGRREFARMTGTTGPFGLDAGDPDLVFARIDLAVNDEGEFWSGRIDLGNTPLRTLIRATVDGPAPSRATVCGSDEPRAARPSLPPNTP